MRLHEDLKNTYATLAAIPVAQLASADIEKAYMLIATLATAVMDMGTDARTMFAASIIGVELSQNIVDGYIATANSIYANGRAIKDKGIATMESIYALDDEDDLYLAKEKMDTLKNTLDTLLLRKEQRATTNETMVVQAKDALTQAEQELQNLQNGYDTIDIKNAKNKVVQAEANVQNIVEKYKNYELRANFDGVITEMTVQVGDNINTNATTEDEKYIYVESADLMEISLSIDQSDILQVQKDMPATITLDVYPDAALTGVISEISTIPTTSSSSQSTYTVKVMFQKPTDKQVLGGMSATVVIITDERM